MSINVLFVCLGNICRSPTAEGVFRHAVEQACLTDSIHIDSAGTGDWHIGKGPDPRTVQEAATRDYDLTALRARQVSSADFAKFDYVIAMDEENLKNLEAMKPAGYEGYLGLFLPFAENVQEKEVPDPYYGGPEGFTLVLDMVEKASAALLQHIKENHLS
ncbi:MAG TPA: low molecular weight protein-tyrosine-phosphatase [Alcanivoracaceae bacterium]|nr:low molecular weight protein-tyrosine-phosphatase [Alcanivoracaceae bacterium]